MTPDSLAFQITTLVVLLGVLTVAILRWNRFRRRVAARFFALMLVQLLAIASVVVAVNRSGHYLPTWAAVVGSEAGTDPRTVLDQRSSSTSLPGPSGWRATPAEQMQDRLQARSSLLETITITGATTGYALPATVYLPGSYSAGGSRRFPLLELQAGYPGNEKTWSSYLDLKDTLDSLIANGSLPAVMVVMPRQNPLRGHDSECVDADPGTLSGSLADTYLSQDVPRYMRQHYRAGLTRRDLIVGGFSTGAYCAANLALRHPRTYAGAIVLSGYFCTIVDRSTGRLFADRTEVDDNCPLLTVARTHPPLAVFIGAAQDNKEDMHHVAMMQGRFPPSDRVRVVITRTGGHSSVAWRVLSRLSLVWMASVFGGSRQATG